MSHSLLVLNSFYSTKVGKLKEIWALESLVLKKAFAFSSCVFPVGHICHVMLVSSLTCLKDASVSSFFSSQAEAELLTHMFGHAAWALRYFSFCLNLMYPIFQIQPLYLLVMKVIPHAPHFYSLSLGMPHLLLAKPCIP